MSRDRILFLLVVLGIVTLLAVVRSGPGISPLEAATKGSYVALGDSYSSGVGAWDRSLDPKADGGGKPCYRAKAAFPNLLSARFKFKLGGASWACSGARTGDFFAARNGQAAQNTHLDENTSLVTLTLGGNDVGFTDALKRCVIKFLEPDACTDQDKKLRSRFDALRTDLGKVLTGIEERAPEARVLVLGYPRFFPEKPTEEIDMMSDDDQRWINGIIRDVDILIGETVEKMPDRFEYVDVYDGFTGHELTAKEPYLRRLAVDLFHLNESVRRGYHPNSKGNQRLAELIGEHVSGISKSTEAAAMAIELRRTAW